MGKSIWSLAIFCHSSKFRTWDKVLHFHWYEKQTSQEDGRGKGPAV